VPEYIHPELVNLAEKLEEDELGEIASQVVEDYVTDEESRQEWLSMHADWLNLYFQKDRPKSPPWEGSSSESIPVLAEACNQFHARAFQAMFPNRNIIRAIPAGKPDPASKDRAERVGHHMSWQLLTNDKTYKKNKDRLLLSIPLHGSCFTKTFRCPVRDRNITVNVRASDLVVPYGTGPRDLEDLERKTEVIWMPLNRGKKLKRDGFFVEEPEAWSERQTISAKNDIDEAHDEAQGVQDPGYADGGYAKILEQHRLWDLDDDGIAEPYIVWVDASTEKCLRVAIRYDTDEAGEPTNDKEPVECYTHYTFLENPDGFYGLGFGHLLGQLNLALNKLLRQTIDAATLANVGNHSGFANKQLAAKKGELQFQLGKFVTTESNAEDISKGIYQFKFPGPHNTIIAMIELLMSRSDRLATVTEALTGQTEKVMQPTTILALIEQSLQVFSTVYERVLGAWEIELEKHYRLNRKFMDPEEYFSVLDVMGSVKEGHAAREDYEDDLQIQPVADPKMSTERQKLAKAEAEYNVGMSSPLIVNNPLSLWALTKRYFEAIGAENIDEILPKPQDQLPKVDDPRMENMGALAPVPMVPPAYPDQDHVAHIEAHYELLNDPVYGVRLSDLGRQTLEEHIQAHASLMYGQTESQDGMGELAPPPGNGGVSPPVAGAVQPGPGLEAGVMGPGEPAQGPVGDPGSNGGIL
jgi:chaperonin GroES